MKMKRLKRFLLLLPVIVLLSVLFFLNYTVQYFRDTAYTFVYDTNVGSVLSFSDELRALSAQGFNSTEHGTLFTNMIMNFNRSMGEKEAIVTFLMDADGKIYHSGAYNENYLSAVLQSNENMSLIQNAYATRSSGEISPERQGEVITMYYHRFYSGPVEYSLFLSVEKEAIASQLNANGVVIPISLLGLLLLFTIQYGILHLVRDEARARKETVGPEEAQ